MKNLNKKILKQLPYVIGYGFLISTLLGLYITAFFIYLPIWYFKKIFLYLKNKF